MYGNQRNLESCVIFNDVRYERNSVVIKINIRVVQVSSSSEYNRFIFGKSNWK